MSTIHQLVDEHRMPDTARRLYEAEVALHLALASRVDACVTAAAIRLHEAIAAHLATLSGDTFTGSKP